MDWNNCVFNACISKRGELDENGDQIKFFCFPKKDDRIQLWIQNSGNPDLKKYKKGTLGKSAGVCYKHFFPDQFIEYKKMLHRSSNPFSWNLFNATLMDFYSGNSETNQNNSSMLNDSFMNVDEEINEEDCNLLNPHLAPTLVLDDLKNYLKENPMREAWSYIINSDCIVLSLIFKKYLSIKYYVYIYNDFSVRGRYGHYNDDSNNVLIINKLTSIKDFLEIQENIENTPICIGINSQTRSPLCKHTIPYEELLSKQLSDNMDRCRACRNSFKNKQDAQRRRDQNPHPDDNNSIVKPADLKNEIKNLKNKLKRLQEKNQKLNSELIFMKGSIDEVRLNAVNDQILKLPEKQRMVVRVCFEFAEIDPRARRYSQEWLCLCLLMRSLSARLYDRLRIWNILPLPTRITLDDRRLNSAVSSFIYTDTLSDEDSNSKNQTENRPNSQLPTEEAHS